MQNDIEESKLNMKKLMASQVPKRDTQTAQGIPGEEIRFSETEFDSNFKSLKKNRLDNSGVTSQTVRLTTVTAYQNVQRVST